MNGESREESPAGDNDESEDFKLAWAEADDRWTEVIEDKGEFLLGTETPKTPEPEPSKGDARGDLPWEDEAAAPQFIQEGRATDQATNLVPDSAEDERGPQPDDEAPPQGDPLEQAADRVFERDPGPGARMDSLHDALASIRERVQSLSATVPGAAGPRPAQTSELALYRAATDDRTYAEVRRHSKETEEHLRRLAALMQDLSLDLRSIVDAARRAIDQTSEQAESSIELGRLLGERIEQMDSQLSARVEGVVGQLGQQLSTRIDGVVGQLGQQLSARMDGVVGQRIDQLDAAVGTLQVHLDKRLTKLEQRAGVGLLREEMGELRNELGEVRVELGGMRDEMGAAADTGSAELQERLAVVGSQLDRTLTTLRDLVEGTGDQDGDMLEGVMGAMKAETEAAVEPFRTEVEQLGQLLTDAVEREQQMGETLATLTDEVQRLRKRIAVRAGTPSIDDDQIQSIVDAVVVAVQGRRPPSRARRRPAPEPEDTDEPEVEWEPEPPPRPVRTARKKRPARPVRAKKAAARPEEEEPGYELDINEPFAEGELDLAGAGLDVEPDEEPIRRAKGEKKRASRPLTKGRRTRSSSR